MIRGISKIEHAIEANMWERARMWEDLPKRIKGKGWVYSMSAWLNGPPDVHDFTLGRQVYETDKLTESQMAAIRSAMRSLARKCSGFELYADRWGMVMRHAIKPIKVKPRKPTPPASAFHQ